MAVFTWTPSKQFTQRSKPRVKRLQFGDGYSQRVPEDINILDQSWDITFVNRGLTEAGAITSFLEDKKGAEAFLWAPTGDSTAISVVCEEWDEKYTSHITRTISVKFTRVYEEIV